MINRYSILFSYQVQSNRFSSCDITISDLPEMVIMSDTISKQRSIHSNSSSEKSTLTHIVITTSSHILYSGLLDYPNILHRLSSSPDYPQLESYPMIGSSSRRSSCNIFAEICSSSTAGSADDCRSEGNRSEDRSDKVENAGSCPQPETPVSTHSVKFGEVLASSSFSV